MVVVIPSQKIANKLSQRGITLEDCAQCFVNRTGSYLFDTREQHQTNPATRWFIAETDTRKTFKSSFHVLSGSS
jgi:hypothetical protein